MVLLYAVPFLIIVIAWFTLGAAATAKPFSDGLVGWLGRVIANIPIAGPITAKMAVAMASWITNKIGGQWRNLERMGVAWLSGLYQWAAVAISQALAWPYYLFRLQSWLLTVEIPKLIRSLPHAGTKVLHAVTTRVVKIERTVVKFPKLSKAQAKALVAAAVAVTIGPYLRWLRWLRSHGSALSHVLAHTLPLPNVPSIPNLWKRVRALEKKFALPLGIAAVTAALARLGLGWIRCGKVKRVGKGVCGLDNSLIDKFLLDALAIFGLASIVEFAEGLQAVEEEAISILGGFVREWPS